MKGLARYIDDDRAFRRLVILLASLIVLVTLGFGGYYYLTRYYYAQPALIERGRERLEEVVVKDPESIEGRMNVAMVYYRGGRLDEAIAQFKEVLKMKGDFQPALIGLGITYAQKNQPDPAIEALEKVVDLRKDDEMLLADRQMQAVFYQLGRMYTLKNDMGRAEEALKKAVQANRTDADAIYALSEVYRLQGKLDAAIAGYTMAVSFVPDFKEAYQGMAAAFEAQGLKPHKTYADGMVRYSEGKYDEAIRLLQQAIEGDSSATAFHFGLGLAYEKKGDKEKAIAALEQALALDPENKLVQDSLRRVKSRL